MRLSFFEDKQFRLIEELGKDLVGGHEKARTEEDHALEARSGYVPTVPDEWDHKNEPPHSDEGFFSRKSPPRLGGVGLKWRAVNHFFHDLEDYAIERKSAANQEFWRKNEKWEFEIKMIQKNRSHFRFKPLSRDEAG